MFSDSHNYALVIFDIEIYLSQNRFRSSKGFYSDLFVNYINLDESNKTKLGLFIDFNSVDHELTLIKLAVGIRGKSVNQTS